MRRLRRTLLLAAALVPAGVAGGGCGSPPASVRVPLLFAVGIDPGRAAVPMTADHSAVLAAGDLRQTLEELFAVHGVLIQGMMRAAGQDRAVQPWLEALLGNNAELTGTIELTLGSEAAWAFDQLWSYQAQFLLDYAVAADDDRPAAALTAVSRLGYFTHDLPSMLVTATQGHARADDLGRAVDRHVRAQIGEYDSFRRGATAEALAARSDDREALVAIGTSLATAIAEQNPAAFPGDAGDTSAAHRSSVALRAVAFVDGVLASAIGGGPAWRDPLRQLGEASGVHVEGIDPFTDDPGRLAAVFLGGVTEPSAEQELDANDLATLGQRLSPADFVLGTVPATLRAAYASAYRLAAATSS